MVNRDSFARFNNEPTSNGLIAPPPSLAQHIRERGLKEGAESFDEKLREWTRDFLQRDQQITRETNSSTPAAPTTGAQGIQGMKGDKGDIGDRGPKGDRGVMGNPGNNGESFLNMDGGSPTTVYGGVNVIDGGAP